MRLPLVIATVLLAMASVHAQQETANSSPARSGIGLDRLARHHNTSPMPTRFLTSRTKAAGKNIEPMSDEFDGDKLDDSKWALGLYWWKGRQPALFSDKNVTVSDGKLHLTMRKEKVPQEFEKLGYKDYTSAALHSKVRSSYGYYEVKAKPMNSAGSSSFWFQKENVPGWMTEIDVFEIGGKAPGFEKKVNMNVHVFRTPKEKNTGASAVPGSPRGGWPITTTFTAWSGPPTRSSILWTAWLCEPSKTRTGINRFTSSLTVRRCLIGSECRKTRICRPLTASSTCGRGSGRVDVADSRDQLQLLITTSHLRPIVRSQSRAIR